MTKKNKVFDSKQPTLVNFGFKKQIIHCGEAINVDVPKFARPDTYNKVQCPKCPQRFKNNQGLGTTSSVYIPMMGLHVPVLPISLLSLIKQ